MSYAGLYGQYEAPEPTEEEILDKWLNSEHECAQTIDMVIDESDGLREFVKACPECRQAWTIVYKALPWSDESMSEIYNKAA